MNSKTIKPLLVTIVVGLVVSTIALLGIDVPNETVEPLVSEQIERVLPSEEADEEIEGWRVVTIIDGDTIVIERNGTRETVRVLGLDTPEVAGSPQGEECYGAEASAFARGMLTDESVRVSIDPTQATYDRFDRLLAYVTLSSGEDFGEKMIENGYAYEYTYSKAYKKQSLYQAAEQRAKDSRAGVWGSCE